jgi:hypothetical protein
MSHSRRNFLKLISICGAAALAPPVLFAEPKIDVRGWRFGVWELTDHYGIRHGQKYFWCCCDCGAERVVGLNQLLSIDALSCAHVRQRGFFRISPDAMVCQHCGERRRLFFNGDGLRIWRCSSWCEAGDVYAFLRRDYGPASSVQFAGNMKRPPRSSPVQLPPDFFPHLAPPSTTARRA